MSNILEIFPSKLHSSSEFDATTVISITVFFSLICACIIIGHLLEENRWANESITALLLGFVSGAIVLLFTKGQNSQILVFSEELFFIYLLPPIIFNAGFQVKKKQFFKNFTTILLFGVLGTIISFCLISLGAFLIFKRIGVTNLDFQDYLAVGAILSATDSVCTLQVLNQDETPFLYSMVFGEGVVNDATSIVLFNAVQSIDSSNLSAMTALSLVGTFLYLFCTSTILGLAVGLLSAFIIKTLYIGRHSTDREIAIMMVMAYVSYMIAELMNLSGILTVFFCGVIMSHYTWHNVTEGSRITTKHAFATMSFIAETFIFLYVGMDALDIDKWKDSDASAGTSFAVSATLLAMVLVGRAAFVFPLANIANATKNKESEKIPFHKQFIIWWAGLMRGAVTIALSYNQFSDSDDTTLKDNSLMITSTIIVVLFSTMVFGSVTKPLIDAMLGRSRPAASYILVSFESLGNFFLPKPIHEEDDDNDNNEENERRSNGQGCFAFVVLNPTWTAHYLWKKFDKKFMRPVFGGSPDESSDQNQIQDENQNQGENQNQDQNQGEIRKQDENQNQGEIRKQDENQSQGEIQPYDEKRDH